MELWDIRDESGAVTGRVIERGRPLQDGEFHLIVDVWIKNAKGEYLISRRSPFKEPEAGRWEPTCGCAISGDSSLEAALRETREELGIDLLPENGKMIKRFLNSEHRYMVDVWLFHQEVDMVNVVLQPGETDAAKWAAISDIADMQRSGSFIRYIRIPYLDQLP
ncbi:MAG: NUDIX hydrolase [Christensenellales bacterium]|jgi:8-oxo-dGTP diphosphatase